MARSVAFRKCFRFISPYVSRAARISRKSRPSKPPNFDGGYHYMHVKRYLALFLGGVLSNAVFAAVSIIPADDQIEYKFTYTDHGAVKTVGVAGEFSNWS